MCQTTAPLTKKSSHLLWNAFSQWLPLDLASVEVKVWCLITFGGAIFCSSFQLRKPKKESATSPKAQTEFLCSFLSVHSLFCSFFSFGFAKSSLDMRLSKVWCIFLKVKSDTILSSIRVTLKCFLEHCERLTFSTERQWKWNSSRHYDTPFLHKGWKNRNYFILSLLKNH